jgi:pimeloyl-ACP methyl ester carboxylesterase
VRTGLGRRAGVALVAVLLTLLSVTSWPVPAASAATCGADMGSRQVVVLVHGFHSDITTWTKAKPAMLAAIHDADPAHVYVRLFDYAARSTQWVTDPAIGPALASFVRCLAQASTNAGGPGKVILVGHSMGGLAIRCALDAGCAPNPVGKDQVGLVVTIGTPNAGSQLRPSPDADATARTAGDELLALCDIAQFMNGDEWLTQACRYADALGASPAAKAFTIGSHEIDELAPYPLHIPVRAIAGAITLQANIGLWKYPVPMGDIVVGVDSQLLLHTDDRLGGTRTIDCGTVNILGGAVGILIGLHCWHITETAFTPIQNEVRQAITDYLTANPPTQEPLVINSQGVGPFHPGMSLEKANNAALTVGAHLDPPEANYHCRVIRPPNESYRVLLFGAPEKIVAVVTHGPGPSIRTDRGVGVGSTLRTVLAVYPEASQQLQGSGSSTTLTADYPDGTSIQFLVDPSTNKVWHITAGSHDEVHAYEICS